MTSSITSYSHETMVSILGRHVQERPDHQIFRWVDKKCNVLNSLSYKDLWEQALAVAFLLEKQGVKKGDRVMIAFPFGLEFLAGLFGCMMTGCIACSVYPPNPKQLKVDLPAFNLKVNDAGAKFALTTSAFRRFMGLNNFVGNKSQVKWLATTGLRAPPKGWTSPVSVDEISPDDIAFIQYTSGSTGFPKGVMISQRSLVYNSHLCSVTCNALSVSDPQERANFTIASWMPQYHDMGLIGFFFTVIYCGANGVACSPLDFILNPILWHDMMIKYKCRATLGPNFSFGLLAKRLQKRRQPIEKWTFVDRAVCAAEPVDPEVMEQVISVLGVKRSNLYIGYGLAEVGLAVCFTPYSVLNELVACGDLEGEAKVCIVNEACQKVTNGTVGEVFVQSPNQAALGYWGNSKATLSTFSCTVESLEGDWLATGDLGKIVGNKVYITGRLKELIIINGVNKFPVDIERVVEKEYPNVIRPGCVVAIQYSNEGVGLVADLRKGVKQADFPTASDISKLISRECQVQTEFICLLKTHGVPKTTSGKIKRTEVKKISLAGAWPKKMIEMEWQKQQNNQRKLQPQRRDSSLQLMFSVSGASSTDDFVSTELFAEVSRKSLSIRSSVSRQMQIDLSNQILEGEDETRMEDPTESGAGAACPFAKQKLAKPKSAAAGGKCPYGFHGMANFYSKHGTGPYENGGTQEDATLDYHSIIQELQRMEEPT